MSPITRSNTDTCCLVSRHKNRQLIPRGRRSWGCLGGLESPKHQSKANSFSRGPEGNGHPAPIKSGTSCIIESVNLPTIWGWEADGKIGIDIMDRVEIYKGYEIRAYEREPGRWLAKIRKADGSMLEIPLPDGGTRESITTSAATMTAEAAINLAKQAIDGGGMR